MQLSEPEQVVEPAAGPPRKQGRFGRDVLKLSSGAVVAQAITLLTYPIIARLFLPEEFGVWQVFTAMVLVISAVVCLRYEMAIVLPERDEEAANVFGVSIGVALGISALSAVVVLAAGRLMVRVLNTPGLGPYLWLMPVALLIHGVWRATSAWNTRMRRFGRQSLAQVAGSATTSALPIGLGLFGQGGAGVLVVAWVLGWVANTGVLVIQVWRDAWRLFRRAICWPQAAVALRRYRKFPLVDTWGTLFNAVSWQLPSLLLSAFFSEAVVGYYSPANRAILLPLSLLGDAIVPVFLQRASEVRNRPQELAYMATLLFRRLVALGLFPAALLTVAGREVFTLFLGSNWSESGIYVQILAPWMFFLFTSIPLSVLFTVLERQEFSFVIQVLILVSRVLALVVGGLLHNVYLALAIWTVTGVLIYGGLAVWNLRLAGVSLSMMGRVFLEHSLYALPAVAALLALKVWIGASAWWVCGAMAVLLGFYGLWTLRRDPTLLQYLRSVVGTVGRGSAG
jgi:lipopolysaccharide exporter